MSPLAAIVPSALPVFPFLLTFLVAAGCLSAFRFAGPFTAEALSGDVAPADVP